MDVCGSRCTILHGEIGKTIRAKKRSKFESESKERGRVTFENIFFKNITVIVEATPLFFTNSLTIEYEC